MSVNKKPAKPRILIVTPEITYLPSGMGNMAQRMSAKAGGLADVSASLVSALFELGADVHVAMPNYRRMFQGDIFNLHEKELRKYHEVLPDTHIHLAEDRIFYYREQVYSNHPTESMRIALVFQREVINHIIPRVRPDLIHCNDWMTALIPGMARRRGIKSLFTVHNIHTRQVSLAQIEEAGIDAAEFWMNLYFCGPPVNYYHARSHVPVDLLTSGIFAAHYINTVSPRFLWEIVEGWHSGGAGFGARRVAQQIPCRLLGRHSQRAGCLLRSGDRRRAGAQFHRGGCDGGQGGQQTRTPARTPAQARIPTRRSSSGRHGSIRSRKARSCSPTSSTSSSPTIGSGTCRWWSSPTVRTNNGSRKSSPPSISTSGCPWWTLTNDCPAWPTRVRISC